MTEIDNDELKTEAYDYDLPPSLIAQEPLPQRDDSRLLVLQKDTGAIEHSTFSLLPYYLAPGDLLVMNDTKVFPARLRGRKLNGGPVEILLLRHRENGCWEVLCQPGKRAKPGTVLLFGEGELEADVLDTTAVGEKVIRFRGSKPVESYLSDLGQIPLPPYIKKELQDKERYQTIYARSSGSVAAPTAGLHFTEHLFQKLKQKGIEWVFITLHVGAGTFRPVKTEYVTQHRMHSERYSLEPAVADRINRVKEQGSRVVAVGTTCCRVLETLAQKDGRVKSATGETDLYIYPGYRFKAVDVLITNFHLPRSTLLMLVSAFAGREKTLQAYREAVQKHYRFYSFGDAMLII